MQRHREALFVVTGRFESTGKHVLLGGGWVFEHEDARARRMEQHAYTDVEVHECFDYLVRDCRLVAWRCETCLLGKGES